MMDGKGYALKRAQAQRNIKQHIDKILSKAAQDITAQARGITLVSSYTMFRQMIEARSVGIIENAEKEIAEYIVAYSKASISVLGDKDTGATGRLLNSDLFGKTFAERNNSYMENFLYDVTNMLIAAKRNKLKQSDTENIVKSEYKDPYTNGIITKANNKGAGIATPSYGRGIYHSAYENIIRNAQGTVAIAWGRELRNYAKRNGAKGFRVHRGSSYPCDICDAEVAKGVHPITDEVPPFHVRCVCWIEFVN
ncbi:MAG: hypothetical protein SO442_04100 [Prevotella sp.]|nr:hypothetical protein [Prevotella sp.]